MPTVTSSGSSPARGCPHVEECRFCGGVALQPTPSGLIRRSSGRGYRLRGEKSTFQISNSNSSPLSSWFTTALTRVPSSSVNWASAIFFPNRPFRLSAVRNRKLHIPPSFISSTRRSDNERRNSFALGLLRTNAATRAASSFRNFRQPLISRPDVVVPSTTANARYSSLTPPTLTLPVMFAPGETGPCRARSARIAFEIASRSRPS